MCIESDTEIKLYYPGNSLFLYAKIAYLNINIKCFDVSLPITCVFVCTYILYNTYKHMQVFEVRPNHIM